MTTIDEPRRPSPAPLEPPASRPGPLGRLGVWVTVHARLTSVVWLLVVVTVFFTFALSGPLPPKEVGIVLGVAVLLDAFLVRLVLLPVLLRLTGRAAWWAPWGLTRILPNIHFSHS